MTPLPSPCRLGERSLISSDRPGWRQCEVTLNFGAGIVLVTTEPLPLALYRFDLALLSLKPSICPHHLDFFFILKTFQHGSRAACHPASGVQQWLTHRPNRSSCRNFGKPSRIYRSSSQRSHLPGPLSRGQPIQSIPHQSTPSPISTPKSTLRLYHDE